MDENFKADSTQAPSVILESKQVARITKILQLNDEKIYLRIWDDTLLMRSVDFKEGLLLVDLKTSVKNNFKDPLDLMIYASALTNSLENFENKTKCVFNVFENLITVLDEQKPSYSNKYVVPYVSSKQETEYLNMSLLTQITPYAQFEIGGSDLLKLTKSATAVDSTINFLLIKDTETKCDKIFINTRKEENLFQTTDLIQNKIVTQVINNLDKVYQQYLLYYPNTRLTNLIKINELMKYKIAFYEDYLSLESLTEGQNLYFIAYLPLKKATLL